MFGASGCTTLCFHWWILINKYPSSYQRIGVSSQSRVSSSYNGLYSMLYMLYSKLLMLIISVDWYSTYRSDGSVPGLTLNLLRCPDDRCYHCRPRKKPVESVINERSVQYYALLSPRRHDIRQLLNDKTMQ